MISGTTDWMPVGKRLDMSELDDFEEFAAEALRQGFTVHLKHYRFHPAHIAWAPSCVSRIELDVIPITEEADRRCPGKGGYRQSREYIGERISDVLPPAWEFLRGEVPNQNLAPSIISRKRRSPEFCEAARQRMNAYWAKKKVAV